MLNMACMCVGSSTKTMWGGLEVTSESSARFFEFLYGVVDGKEPLKVAMQSGWFEGSDRYLLASFFIASSLSISLNHLYI